MQLRQSFELLVQIVLWLGSCPTYGWGEGTDDDENGAWDVVAISHKL